MLQKGLFKMLLCPRHRSGILIYHIITHLMIVHNVVQVRCIWFFTCLPSTNINQIFRASKSFWRQICQIHLFSSFLPCLLPFSMMTLTLQLESNSIICCISMTNLRWQYYILMVFENRKADFTRNKAWQNESSVLHSSGLSCYV